MRLFTIGGKWRHILIIIMTVIAQDHSDLRNSCPLPPQFFRHHKEIVLAFWNRRGRYMSDSPVTCIHPDYSIHILICCDNI